MKLQDILNENVGEFDVVQTGSDTDEGDPKHYEPDVTTVYYDILKDGEKVGELETTDYFGYIHGHLYNKTLPEISGYGGPERDRDDPQAALNAFLSSKTGQRWYSNIDKYKGLPGPTNDYRLKDQSYDYRIKKRG